MSTVKHEEEKAKKGKPDDSGKDHGHGKPEDTPGKGPERPTQQDHRNYPRSPEPGKGPEPYPPAKGLAKDEEALPDPTPPVFPIGTEPELLGIEPKTTGDTTDMERMESHNLKVGGVKPEHCPMCRGRGFIGGAECPDCKGTGLGPEVEPDKKSKKSDK